MQKKAQRQGSQGSLKRCNIPGSRDATKDGGNQSGSVSNTTPETHGSMDDHGFNYKNVVLRFLEVLLKMYKTHELQGGRKGWQYLYHLQAIMKSSNVTTHGRYEEMEAMHASYAVAPRQTAQFET